MDAPEYYKTRLEHTIELLQRSTQLTYLVSGAVLAMLYFVLEKIQNSPLRIWLSIGLLLLLSSVNIIHALLITIQSRWYKAIDKEFAESLGVVPVSRGKTVLGSSGLWADLHWLIALAGIVGGVVLLWWGENL